MGGGAVTDAPQAPVERVRKLADCQFDGCHRVQMNSTNRYCSVHVRGVENRCKVDGCNDFVASGSKPLGYCHKHMPNRTEAVEYMRNRHKRKREEEEIEKEKVYEEVRRLQRDHNLRARMLPIVAEEQNNRCANAMLTCKIVEDGKATPVCQWGDREVEPDAQQLDHIVPYHQTQDDSRENLQMLCACCHAMKSAAEARAKVRGEVAMPSAPVLPLDPEPYFSPEYESEDGFVCAA